ncbi:MAG: cellulase family glycosylhydrolase, partial [Muribaculum sp.]|nr:cellulase family glycosylhydrolase [Muribaculum sp.]
MIKFKSFLLAASAVALGFTMGACDDDDTTVVNEVVVPSTEVNVPVAGQTLNFDVTASVRPTVSADASWITVGEVVAAENNTYKLSFVVEPNEDADGNPQAPRSATIAVSAFNSAAFIAVKQEGVITDYDINYGDLPMESTAAQIAAKMGVAVNIGNTLEAPDGETSWSNPQVSQTYVAGLKAMGFDAVRIPCAWVCHYAKEKDVMGNDSVTTTIDPAWMARVKQVVSYCIDNDLYVVLNDHWDNGWIENRLEEGYHSSLAEQLADLWTQIATEFNAFDEHLVFAGLNEPGMNGEITASALDALTKYEQAFIDAVRATGGNNATRTLVVQGPLTNIDATVDASYVMPVDAVADRLMVEVHFYDPYQFALMEEDADWGKTWWYYG